MTAEMLGNLRSRFKVDRIDRASLNDLTIVAPSRSFFMLMREAAIPILGSEIGQRVASLVHLVFFVVLPKVVVVTRAQSVRMIHCVRPGDSLG